MKSAIQSKTNHPRKELLTSLTIILLLFHPPSQSFSLNPKIEVSANGELAAQSGVSWPYSTFNPIHEELTIKSLKKAKESTSSTITIDTNELIYGVRWNDDPLNYVSTRPLVWYTSLGHSCSISKIDEIYDLMYRSHCGDMQFLHSMASKKNERPELTIDKILMWSEFSFKIATGRIKHSLHFHSVKQYLSNSKSKDLFTSLIIDNGDRRTDWTPSLMFNFRCTRRFLSGLQCPPNFAPAESTRDRALGSLLHLIQDSFSDSHVLRHPDTIGSASAISGRGPIVEFLSFNDQSRVEHSKADKRIVLEDTPHQDHSLNVVEIGAKLILICHSERVSKDDHWPLAKELLLEVFNLDEHARPSSSGRKYKSLERLSPWGTPDY